MSDRPDAKYEWIVDIALRRKVQTAWNAYSQLQAAGVYQGWTAELIAAARTAWDEYSRLTREAAR